ncbi:MAG: hypothetical protein IGR93_00755 [Hydrococcus sp. C42_A2020_068]|nr:hypothetical protein [Hydrococcus sp. C42_A2020_068]
MKRDEIKQKIFKLTKVSKTQEFKYLFPELSSYNFNYKKDCQDALSVLECEPEMVDKVLLSVRKTAEVIGLEKFHKQRITKNSCSIFWNCKSDVLANNFYSKDRKLEMTLTKLESKIKRGRK